MKRPLLLLTLLAFATSAPAQNAPPPRPVAPSGTLLESAPDFSRWEIDFIYTDDEPKGDKPPVVNRSEQARRLRHVITTKTGKIIHEVSLYLSGKQIETWHNGKAQYDKPDGTPTWMAKEGNLNPEAAATDKTSGALPASGFRDLEWVDAKAYVGTLPYGNRTCLVFVQRGADKLDLSDPDKLKKLLDSQDTVAYIDSETRLPISLRMGKTVRSYRFIAPPTEMQTFPADLAGQIKKGEDARNRLNVMAPRPY